MMWYLNFLAAQALPCTLLQTCREKRVWSFPAGPWIIKLLQVCSAVREGLLGFQALAEHLFYGIPYLLSAVHTAPAQQPRGQVWGLQHPTTQTLP